MNNLGAIVKFLHNFICFGYSFSLPTESLEMSTIMLIKLFRRNGEVFFFFFFFFFFFLNVNANVTTSVNGSKIPLR